MGRFNLASCIGLLLFGLACGCGGDDKQSADYGEPCSSDAECASQLCVVPADSQSGFCSKTCRLLADCPAVGNRGWDCGRVPTGQVACYPRTYRAEKFAMGHDCSLDGKCALGYRCMGERNAADRFCSNKCKSDMDCPPTYWCSQVRVGTELESEKRCRRRQFCHPCVIDEQCGGSGNLCIKDSRGDSYCSKACSKTGMSCPAFARCEDAGNNTLQCRHKAGACFSPLGEGEGGLCDPCLFHGWTTNSSGDDVTIAEEGGCKAGSFCYLLDRYSGEAACVTPCTSRADCPSPTHACFKIPSLGSFCAPLAADDVGTCFP